MGKADERMLALWHALDATKRGLSKQEIRSMVPGYSSESSVLAFEKMFTRDKNALRELGSQLETYVDGTGLERYRLTADDGPTVDLTLAEAAAVRLAASIWASGDLHDDAAEAAAKVTGAPLPSKSSQPAGGRSRSALSLSQRHRGSGNSPDSQGIGANDAALIAHIPASGVLIRPLLTGIAERSQVRFDYRSSSSGQATTRLVEPWRVAFRDGGWYLLGHEVERGGARAFRLSRVVGEIMPASPSGFFETPSDVDVSDLLGETGHTVTATFALAEGRGARLRALSVAADSAKVKVKLPSGFEIFQYKYDDERDFADELAGLGSGVIVLEPPHLKEAVVARLKAAANLSTDNLVVAS